MSKKQEKMRKNGRKKNISAISLDINSKKMLKI